MKPLLKLFMLAVTIVITATSCYVSQAVSQQPIEPYVQQEISFNTFYDELSPYGSWIDYPSYGRVWVCNEPGFSPYHTGGNWSYTSYGWTWVSDYNWGWAPFHYGRWASDPMYGWFWVPGYEWAPAWVGWRSGNGYYGWAPLSPGLNISIGASYNSIPSEHWSFLPNQYMGHPQMRNYYVNNSRNYTIINNTTIINTTNVYRNATFTRGPERGEVERYSGRRITPMEINDTRNAHESGNNNGRLNMYRPSVKRDDAHDRQPYGNTNQQQNRGNNDQNRQRPTPPIVTPGYRDDGNRNPGNNDRQLQPVNNDQNRQRPTPPIVTPGYRDDGNRTPGNSDRQQQPVNNDQNRQRPTPPIVSPGYRDDGNRTPGNNDQNRQRPINAVTPTTGNDVPQRRAYVPQQNNNSGSRPGAQNNNAVNPNTQAVVRPVTQPQQPKRDVQVKPLPTAPKATQDQPEKPKEGSKKPDQ